LSQKDHSAALFLNQYFSRHDGDGDGVLTDVELVSGLTHLAPSLQTETLGSIARHISSKDNVNQISEHSTTSSSSEAPSLALSVGVPIKKLTGWVLASDPSQGKVQTIPDSSHVGASQLATWQVGYEQIPTAPESTLQAADLTSLDGPNGSYTPSLLTPRKATIASFSNLHKKRAAIKDEVDAIAYDSVEGELLDAIEDQAAAQTPSGASTDRTPWASNKALNDFATFSAAWTNKHGIAARKEQQLDSARAAEGPSWTRAGLTPFRVVHLVHGPPPPTPVS
jgi:hypothetical protein